MEFYVKSLPLPEDETCEAAWVLKSDFYEYGGCKRVVQTNIFKISYFETTLWRLNMESIYNVANHTKVMLTMVDSDRPIENLRGKITLENLNANITTIEKEFGPCSFEKNNVSVPVWSPTELIILNGSILRIEIYGVKSVTSLPEDMRTLLLADDFSDVLLKVGDKCFHAHKAILGARSSVFRAMFKSGMQEQKTSIVNIEDLESEVIEEMRRYAYSGQVNNLKKLSLGLVMAADKYNMRGLRIKCIDSLLRTLNFENSLERLTVADFISDTLFKQDIIYFIALNFNEVIKTPNWDSWSTSHPILQKLVLEAVCMFKLRQ